MEKRQTPFGSLRIQDNSPIDDGNLKRLLQLDVINELKMFCLNDELALLPFSAKVDHLDYWISSSSLLNNDFQLQNIVPSKLTLEIVNGSDAAIDGFPTKAVISFFRRVADLGHFVELTVAFGLVSGAIPDCVIHEIIETGTAIANIHLTTFVLHAGGGDLDWSPHVKTILDGLKNHQGCLTFKTDILNHASDSEGFSYFRELLSQNRRITVLDTNGEV